MKNKIRKEMFAMRLAQTEEEADAKSKVIFQKIIKSKAYENADLILAYIDAKGEVKTKALLEHAWSSNKMVAVPKVHGDFMEFYIIESYEDLESGCFGIKEPVESCRKITELTDDTLVIMPGVAFDKSGNRIGYGKGYYDKYFSRYPDVYKIAVAYSFQIVPDAYAKGHDMKADCVLTEG